MIEVLLFLNIINTFIVFSFMNTMYKRKYDSKIVYVVAIILFYSIHVFINSFRIYIVNILLTITIIHVLGRALFKDADNKSEYNLMFALYLIFMDSAAFSIVSLILIQPLLNTMLSGYSVVIGTIIQYTIVFLTYKIIVRKFLKNFDMTIYVKENVVLCMLAIFELSMLTYLWNIKSEIGSVCLLLLSTGFTALDIYLIYLFKIVNKQKLAKHELDLIKQQSMILKHQIQDAQNRYKETKKHMHDMRGYLSIIESLTADQKMKEARILKEQLGYIFNKLKRIFCENVLLNAIMNDRMDIAQMRGIKTDFMIQSDINWSFMKEIHMTSLFLNLLNNAIEACDQISGHEKFIDCRVKQIRCSIAIRIENSYAPQYLVMKNGKYLTSKEEHFGIGLTNIQKVVNQYCGLMKIHTDDSVFRIEIYLSIVSPKREEEFRCSIEQ